MRNILLILLLTAVVVFNAAFSCAGQMTPESQRGVEGAAPLPGMAEALEVKDRTIRTAILTSIKMDVELAQNNIEIDVKDGLVTLTGTVPTEEMKKRAEQYAKQTEAVRDVLNKIEVDPALKDKQFALDDG